MTKAVIVTGASGALGRAVVATLAAAGWSIVGLDLAAEMPDLGQAAFYGKVDLADAGVVERLFAQIGTAHGPLSGLVNIAGGFVWQTVADGDPGAWDRLYRLNLVTALTVSRTALAQLREHGGAIVNVGAAAAGKAAAGMGAYAASKAAVARFTESLAEEEKDRGVRVNAVLPSVLDTSVNRLDMPDADFSRWVEPKALAEVIAFLLSDGARAITGACLPVTARC
jgi:NAD(P)-dependent dehydrogenase (short-subunit alcohol dehydrogenase family)